MQIIDGAEAMENEQEIEWFWDKRIPKKAITVLAAEGGEGKSALALWIALKLGCRLAKKSMYIDAEQTFVHLTSRLRKWATPNEARRLFIPTEKLSESSLVESATPSMKEIARYAFSLECELVVIDSLTTISDELDITKRNQATQLMKTLKIIAGEANCAVLLIAHVNKKQDPTKEIDVDSICGNKAVSDLSRSVFLLTSEKDDPTEKKLIHVKSNWSPRQPNILYSMADDGIEDFREDSPIDEGQPASATQAEMNEIALQIVQEGGNKKRIREAVREAGGTEINSTRAVYYVKTFGHKV